MSPGLHDLPYELLLNILRQSSSPQDLDGLIRASKPGCIIFQENKAHVLAATVRQAIPSDAIADAYAAYKAPGTAKTKVPTAELVDSFISEIRTWRQDENLQLDLPTSTAICRLWTITNSFIQNFASSALRSLQKQLGRRGVGNSEQSHWVYQPELSYCEVARFQRAFFRLEMIRKLSRPDPDELLHSSQVDTLLGEFEAWERDEISWVYTYLESYMARRFAILEDNFVAKALDLAKESFIIEKNLSDLEVVDVSSIVEWFCLRHVSREAHIDYVINFGLPFVRLLSKSEPDHKISLLYCYQCTFWRPRLGNVVAGRPLAATQQASRHPIDDSSAAAPVPTRGWEWTQSHQAYCQEFDFDEDLIRFYKSGPRCSGLNFWDDNRLHEMGFLGLSGQDVGRFPRFWNHLEVRSVEERLAGVMMRITRAKTNFPELLQEKRARPLLETAEY
ncbi:MAG: hypothetical protein MMC23_001767 [Stictis urceolatum]|nr:hypothetical protein [Stictis urceolata]